MSLNSSPEFHASVAIKMVTADNTEKVLVEISQESKDSSPHQASSLESQDAVGKISEGPTQMRVSKLRGIAVIVTLSGISFLNTMGSGILIAALPRIASDVGLDESLILVSTFHAPLPSPLN